jgi:hypothetical protein
LRMGHRAMTASQNVLIRILRAAGFRILESDASRLVVRRGNRTVDVPLVDGIDDDRFLATLGALGMSRATLDALSEVSGPPSSHR